MKRKVLILISDFMFYADSAKRAFENMGWEVKVLPAHLSLNENQYFLRFLAYMGFSTEKDFLRKRREYNQLVVNTINSYKPDLVYCSFLPRRLEKETILLAKKTSKLLISLPDTLATIKDGDENIELFDAVFSYERNDVRELKKRGINAYATMGTYDDEHYYHIDCEKTIDVSFVGKMYKERVEILERLAKDLPSVDFVFYGVYAPLRKPLKYLRWRFDKRYHIVFKNCNIHYSKVNEIYNHSKIVLDIHCNRCRDGWSSRLPEISATGSLQIVDKQPAIVDEFGDDFVTYEGYDDLKEKIVYYLANDEARQRKATIEMQRISDMTSENSIRRKLAIAGIEY